MNAPPEGQRPNDVRRLLKVYNYVNDERRSRLNVKFLGVLAVFLLSATALGLYLFVQSPSQGGNHVSAPASRTDYVGLTPQEIAAGSLALQRQTVEERLADWRADHPGAVIESQERVEVSGVTVGYRITWHPAE